MRQCVFLFLLMTFSSSIYCAESLNTIHLASEEWEGETNKDGSGLYWEIFRSVYQLDKITVKFQIVPYARSVGLAKLKKIDAWVASYKDDEDFALYPQWHFDAEIVSALFKKERFPDWKGVESLADKKVGWIRGYDIHEQLDVKMNFEELNNRTSALGLLSKNRIDVYLDALADIQKFIKNEKPLETIQFNMEDYRLEKLLQLNLFLGFANTERGKELIKIWDKNFLLRLNDGTIKKLYQKYNNELYDDIYPQKYR